MSWLTKFFSKAVDEHHPGPDPETVGGDIIWVSESTLIRVDSFLEQSYRQTCDPSGQKTFIFPYPGCCPDKLISHQCGHETESNMGGWIHGPGGVVINRVSDRHPYYKQPRKNPSHSRNLKKSGQFGKLKLKGKK